MLTVSSGFGRAPTFEIPYGYILTQATPTVTEQSDSETATFYLVGGSGTLEPNIYPTIHCWKFTGPIGHEIFSVTREGVATLQGKIAVTDLETAVEIQKIVSLIDQGCLATIQKSA